MRMSGVQFHQLTISKIISDTTTQNHQKPNILDRILKDDYRLTKILMYNYLKHEKTSYSENIRIKQHSTKIENKYNGRRPTNKPTLKDVLNSLS